MSLSKLISSTYFVCNTGSMDGTHIRIDKPLENPDSYINRKQYFSIQLQGVVNHQ